MDGSDRQSDVSSMKERRFHRQNWKDGLPWEDESALSPGCPRNGKMSLWWQCCGRNSQIDRQENSVPLKFSDSSENSILQSTYTLSAQADSKSLMQLETPGHSLHSVLQGPTCYGPTSPFQTLWPVYCALNRPSALPPQDLSSGCSIS